jgi:hypothetical protein
MLAIEVPNDPDWRVYASHHSPHVTFFTPASLEPLLANFGKVLFIDTAGHFGRRKRPHWQDAALRLAGPIRSLRSALKARVNGPTVGTGPNVIVGAQDEDGGEERGAVRAIVRI